jgi:hypothetical protein
VAHAEAQLVVTGGGQVSTGNVLDIPTPRIVQLPSDDFVYNWGEASIEDRAEPDFEVDGVEERFFCHLSGGYDTRRLSGEDPRRAEDALASTLYFIQVATDRMNSLYKAEALDWATLDCKIPDGTPSEEQLQERVDQALHRAERQRERRRARNGDAE